MNRKNLSHNPKIAFVHDWLVTYGGAEGVLESLLEIWPDAPIHCLVYDSSGPCREIIQNSVVIPSLIHNLPYAKKKYQSYLPLMPFAVEQFDLSNYEIVVSSSHAVAKGVITGPDQLHLSYVHSPIRYAWELTHLYLKQSGLTNGINGLFAKAILHYIRSWDIRTANGVDHFIANSQFVARRIWKTYRRKASVIYPPVDVENFNPGNSKEKFFLTISRMVPYKNVELIVGAFNSLPNKKLVVVGDGPQLNKIRNLAGPNMEFLGFQDKKKIIELMQHAQALVFAAKEDFGIVPVEAQACGTPVIAYGEGGALETIIDGKTGIFFREQTQESIIDAIECYENNKARFCVHEIRQNAERFSKKRFMSEFNKLFDNELDRFHRSKRGNQIYDH